MHFGPGHFEKSQGFFPATSKGVESCFFVGIGWGLGVLGLRLHGFRLDKG